MPFKSKAQQRWMFATHPDMAKEWAHETDFKKIPERVKKKKRAEGRKEALAKLGLDENAVPSGPPALLPEEPPPVRTDTVDKEAAMTLPFLRTVARDNDVDLKTPHMEAQMQALTGVRKPKDMKPTQLQQVAQMIWSKTATVPGPVKQYRRAFASMANRSHDWHGTSPERFQQIRTTGTIPPTGSNLNGNPPGVYVARGEPEMPYYRQGYGVAVPADAQGSNPQLTPSVGAAHWRSYQDPVAVTGPGFVVAPSAAERLPLQQSHHLQPMDPKVLQKAYDRFDDLNYDRFRSKE